MITIMTSRRDIGVGVFKFHFVPKDHTSVCMIMRYTISRRFTLLLALFFSLKAMFDMMVLEVTKVT